MRNLLLFTGFIVAAGIAVGASAQQSVGTLKTISAQPACDHPNKDHRVLCVEVAIRVDGNSVTRKIDQVRLYGTAHAQKGGCKITGGNGAYMQITFLDGQQRAIGTEFQSPGVAAVATPGGVQAIDQRLDTAVPGFWEKFSPDDFIANISTMKVRMGGADGGARCD